jgi:hypothetical protein
MLALRGTGTTVNLGAQGTSLYLFAKYDGPSKGSEVWYVGDLSGVITIPAAWGRYGLSGWALFIGVWSLFRTAVPQSCCSEQHSVGLAWYGA